MNRFNLTMSIAVVAAIVFFGFGIFQKANYKIAEGDNVYVTYSIVAGEDTYDSQSASVEVGNNQNTIITDDILIGAKLGTELNFDTTLTEAVQIDQETSIAEGTAVSIEGVVADVTPKVVEEEVTSETTSEASSEVSSDVE